jgi:hypothetical protein
VLSTAIDRREAASPGMVYRSRRRLSNHYS